MTVYWGSSIPLYSRKLTKEGAAGETVSFAVPADAAGQIDNTMVIAFDLEIKDLDCTPRQLNMPWAYVAEDSSFYLPQGESGMLDLDQMPAPFQHNGLLSDLLLIMSDDPTDSELLLAGRVMSVLGAGCDPYGEFRAVRASEFNSDMYDRNLVIVGTPKNNLFLREFNDSLFFQYSSDYSSVESNDKLVLGSEYAMTVGTYQLLASPYADGRSILIVSSPSEEGTQSLITLTSKDENRWSLEREAVVVDTRGRATSYQFTVNQTSKVEKDSFSDVIMQNQEPMLLLIVGLGCMLVLLLAVVLLLIQIRRGKHADG